MKQYLSLTAILITYYAQCMYINLPPDQYGIGGLFSFSPHTAYPLLELAATLLEEESSTLSRAEREIIASYVSSLNECEFCCNSHSAIAAALLDNNTTLIELVKQDPEIAPIPEKLKALLALAHAVQQSGKEVSPVLIARAQAAAATDHDIHDTVLITAAFCMFNRYVDGLGAWKPDNELYAEIGAYIAHHGYLKALTKYGFF